MPAIFGFTILIVWELVVRGLKVPLVILPPPSMIAETFSAKLPILWKDFVQTFVKGALSGYFIGCTAAVALAVLVERFDFLRRGLLPFCVIKKICKIRICLHKLEIKKFF